MRTIPNLILTAPILELLCFAQPPAITSFTAACSTTDHPANAVTCPTGNNDVLAWSVTGVVSLSIDQGIGTVSPTARGTLAVQPFNTPSVTYTLTATNPNGSSTAKATITLDDDYARVSAWPSVVRAVPFESDVPCIRNMVGADPVYSGNSPNAGGDGTCNNGVIDTTKAVSGSSSFKMTTPGVAGQDPNGSMTVNFSADGRKTFGAGDEFYLQWRQYMDTPYVRNVYLSGGACKANITLSKVSGSFSNGEAVTSDGVPARGNVTSWDSESGVLVITKPNQVQWRVGAVVTGASGATGTITANNGGGKTTADCPGDNYTTGMKQVMIDPEDVPPLPSKSSSQLAANCIADHIVLTHPNQKQFGAMYQGCVQIGGEGAYEGFAPHYFSGSMPETLLQSGTGCSYVANPTAGVRAVAPCVLYEQNVWMTMQIHVKIGAWYLMSQPGYPTATATFSGGNLTAIKITDPGFNWAPGTTITLSAALGSWTLAQQANSMSFSNDVAVATCLVNMFGQIPACAIVNAGNGHYPTGTFAIRWPAHGGPNYRRDSLVERWQASPGKPSVLVETMPYYDIVNNAAQPNDWAQASSLLQKYFHATPGNYGKLWFTGYSTGRDVNAGPYPEAHTWIDNLLVSTKRLPDPGVAVQPPTNLSINKSAYPTVTLFWERNPDSHGAYNETGYDIERCPNQMYNCMAGHTLVPGAVWTVVATNVGVSTRTYTETIPDRKKIYTYRVRAAGANKSDWSNPVTTAVHPPSDLSAAWSGGHVQLSWTQRDETGSFAVERCAGVFQYRKINSFIGMAFDTPACLPTGSNNLGSLPAATIPFKEIANNISGTSNGATITWTDTTAVPGTVYTYRVRSYGAAGSWLNWNSRSGTYAAYTANVTPTEAPSASGTQVHPKQ